MIARFATPEEIINWNQHILNNPDGGNVFASYEFAMQKETGGYKAKFVFVNKTAITVLEKSTPPLGKLWYLPKGPGVVSSKDLFNILDNLKSLAKKSHVFAIKIEPEFNKACQPTLKRHGLFPVKPIIPNPSTITLDISDSLDSVMSKLPQKGRHAIHRAERDGVTVQQVKSSDKNCKIMYKLLQQTAEGQFGIRSYDYFRLFWQRFESAGLGQMFLAYFEGKPVAAAYAMTYGKKSTYKDGASVRQRTAYGASHLLQWKVIEWAKSQGSDFHDLCGSPPSDEISNRNHPHYGIGQFKTAFNKTVTDFVGCYDYVLKPVQYAIWTKLGERIAHRLHYRKHHDSYY